MSDSRVRNLECEHARREVHRLLDGDSPDAESRERLEAHLARCHECRRMKADLEEIQSGLRSLRSPALPDETLQSVLDRTSRAPRQPLHRRWGLDWRAVAAAAVLSVALLGLWRAERSAQATHSDEEVRQAAVEARLALGLASRALHRTESVTRSVLIEEVSGAFQRAPMGWPKKKTAQPRRSET